jgi:hypothetical protein
MIAGVAMRDHDDAAARGRIGSRRIGRSAIELGYLDVTSPVGEGDIEQPVGFIIRVEGHREQAALASEGNKRRDVQEGHRILDLVIEHPDDAGLLHHE